MFQVENQISTYSPNGYMVVYAVNEPETLQSAERLLRYSGHVFTTSSPVYPKV
jgi:hypothetical protein